MLRMRITVFGALVLAFLVLVGTSQSEGRVIPVPDQHAAEEESAMALQISIDAFRNTERIPVVYTCEGENVSPAISWSGAPESTRSFALIMDDPDAPSGTFTHWVVWNIPADSAALERAAPTDSALASGAIQGVNSARRAGYTGPCPPIGHGRHRYYFRLYALDTLLDLDGGAPVDSVRSAMRGHVLGEAEYMGTYSRDR